MKRVLGAAILFLIFSMKPVWTCEGAPVQTVERPRFRVFIDTVSLSITVLDERGKLVTNLPRENFIIYEDGTPQEIQHFSQKELPLRVVILLDTSSSMRMKIGMAQQAAIQFVQQLKEGDEVQVIEFNDQVLTLAQFTSNIQEAVLAIEAAEVGGATELYNALYISMKELDRHHKQFDRRAIIVLSDGADTSSLVNFDDVRELARKINVIIYAISLRGTKEDLRKEKYFKAKYELEVLARETGGLTFAPEELTDLSETYAQILSELKSQYSVGYLSTNDKQDGLWRYLQVVSKAEGMAIRTRTGYYAKRASRFMRRR